MDLFNKKINNEKKLNVIIVTLDGLRVDFVDRLPNLKELVPKSSYFNNLITYAPHSTGAFYAIFSGVYGIYNGVNSYFGILDFKKNKCKLLTEYFQERSYYTLGDSMSDIILPKYGFDKYSSTKIDFDTEKKHSEMIKELSKINKNFFVHFHVRCIHDGLIHNVVRKYKFNDKEYYNQVEKNKENYFNYVFEADRQLGKIIEQLEKYKLLDNSILIVLSDHGCSCGEKFGERYYGALCYDITLKTFILFNNKNIFPILKSDKLVRTIDIMPTILEALNIKQDNKFMELNGKSLFPVIRNEEKEPRIAFSETAPLEGGAPYTSSKEPIIHSIKKENWKLIYTKPIEKFELYDISSDPNEENNLFGKEYKEENEMMDLLKGYVKIT
jgi:arylsulfatase A-like enzyme